MENENRPDGFICSCHLCEGKMMSGFDSVIFELLNGGGIGENVNVKSSEGGEGVCGGIGMERTGCDGRKEYSGKTPGNVGSGDARIDPVDLGGKKAKTEGRKKRPEPADFEIRQKGGSRLSAKRGREATKRIIHLEAEIRRTEKNRLNRERKRNKRCHPPLGR
jgi:hypothetical protein